MVRGGFTGNAMLIADAARQEALAELAERTKSSFYASTSDDESWRHERAQRRSRREQARQVLSQAGAALEPVTGDDEREGEEAAIPVGGAGSARVSADDLEAALHTRGAEDALKRSSDASSERGRAAHPSPPARESRWKGMRRLALPSVRLRAAGADHANESRLAMPGGIGGVHPTVHLPMALPGTLAAETEVAAAKSRKLHNITRVMLIEETYKQRERTLGTGESSNNFALLSQAAMSTGSPQASSGALAAEESPVRLGARFSAHVSAAVSARVSAGDAAAAAEPARQHTVTGLADRVALYTKAATRAVAEARQDLQLHSGWLRSLWLARTQLHALMNDPHSSVPAKVVYWVVVAAILMSSTTFCMETVASLDTTAAQRAYSGVEHASIAVFTAEYAARLVSSPQLRPFFLSWLNTVDLAAILPYYVERGLIASGVAATNDAGRSRIVRVLRVARVLRVLKLGNRSLRIGVVNRAIVESADMLMLLIFLLCICVVVCSSAIYYAERGTYLPAFGFSSRLPFDQTCREAPVCTALETLTEGLCCLPKSSPFRSIPASFWWCIVTLMTVGYGDVVPVTPAGKVVAGVTMVLAVLLLSLPISVIGTEFTQQWLEFKASSHMPDKRHKAPRFMTLRRVLAAHNALLDELLLKTRDVLFEIDDLMARLQDKAKQQKRDASVLAARQSASTMRGKHVAALAAAGLSPNGKGASQRRLGAVEEAAARDIKHETELLFMELELKQRLMRLQELLTQAELLRDPSFLRALEQCRSTYGGLRALARDVAALTEEADDVEEELDAALTAELAAATAATEAAQSRLVRTSLGSLGSMRTLRVSSGSVRGDGVMSLRTTRMNTASGLASRLASVLKRSTSAGQQPASPPRWRASDPLPGRRITGSIMAAAVAEGDETQVTPRDATPRTPGTHRLSANSAPLLTTRFGPGDAA